MQVARQVGASLARAAQPGPVPTAGAGSPVDGAAAGVAAAVSTNVAAASADLAPKSAQIEATAQAAVAAMKAKDAENASRIQAVPADLQEHTSDAGGRGVATMSSAGWEDDDWENFSEGSFEPKPVGPSGAGPGPNVGPGIPPSLIHRPR